MDVKFSIGILYANAGSDEELHTAGIELLFYPLLYVSCTCVTMSVIHSHVVHHHKFLLSYDPQDSPREL